MLCSFQKFQATAQEKSKWIQQELKKLAQSYYEWYVSRIIFTLA